MEIVQGWESLSAMILLVLAFSEGVWELHEAGRKEGEGQMVRRENAKSVIQNIQIIV